jgi:hypothetical protein
MTELSKKTKTSATLSSKILILGMSFKGFASAKPVTDFCICRYLTWHGIIKLVSMTTFTLPVRHTGHTGHSGQDFRPVCWERRIQWRCLYSHQSYCNSRDWISKYCSLPEYFEHHLTYGLRTLASKRVDQTLRISKQVLHLCSDFRLKLHPGNPKGALS